MWPCHCFSLLQFFPHIQQWKSTYGVRQTYVPSAGLVWGTLTHLQGTRLTRNHPTEDALCFQGAGLQGEPGKNTNLKGRKRTEARTPTLGGMPEHNAFGQVSRKSPARRAGAGVQTRMFAGRTRSPAQTRILGSSDTMREKAERTWKPKARRVERGGRAVLRSVHVNGPLLRMDRDLCQVPGKCPEGRRCPWGTDPEKHSVMVGGKC